jgi:hypothetical protein
VNAGWCEFEINLDVAEIEWTLGQWRTMMSQLVRETNMLDPSLLKKESDGEDKEDGKEGSVKAAHRRAKRKCSATCEKWSKKSDEETYTGSSSCHDVGVNSFTEL